MSCVRRHRQFAPQNAPLIRNAWLAPLDVHWPLDDSESYADSDLEADRDLVRTRDQQSYCATGRALSNRPIICGYAALVHICSARSPAIDR